MESTRGMKFDKGKPRLGIIPGKALEEVARVLEYGADKYELDNWKYVEGWDWRYPDACLRHIYAFLDGEHDDPDSGLHHFAHAICSLVFYIVNEKEVELANTKIEEKLQEGVRSGSCVKAR